MPVPLALLFAAALILLAGCAHARHRSAHMASSVALSSNVQGAVPRWMGENHLPQRARAGATLFATSGCTNCHTYLKSGTRNLGAPDLSAIGRHAPVPYFELYVAAPNRFGDRVMPPFKSLGRKRLHQLAVFLAASKGPR